MSHKGNFLGDVNVLDLEFIVVTWMYKLIKTAEKYDRYECFLCI